MSKRHTHYTLHGNNKSAEQQPLDTWLSGTAVVRRCHGAYHDNMRRRTAQEMDKYLGWDKFLLSFVSFSFYYWMPVFYPTLVINYNFPSHSSLATLGHCKDKWFSRCFIFSQGCHAACRYLKYYCSCHLSPKYGTHHNPIAFSSGNLNVLEICNLKTFTSLNK